VFEVHGQEPADLEPGNRDSTYLVGQGAGFRQRDGFEHKDASEEEVEVETTNR